jgi:hypothetical protein
MAQKSGIVDQIKEIRARYGDGNSYSELFSRLSKIERAAKDFDPRNEELQWLHAWRVIFDWQ